MTACSKLRKCINQMFRPKTAIPSWARAEGMGDCTTCKMCVENKECVGYYPAPGLFTVEVDKNDAEQHGVVDDSGGVGVGPGRDSTDNKTI